MIEKIDRILEINHKSFAKLMNVYAQTDVSNRQFASPICIFFLTEHYHLYSKDRIPNLW